jgi:transposase
MIAERGYVGIVQDGADSQKSAAAREFLATNHMICMEWCSTSPDLNAIDNLWDILKRMVNARKPTSDVQMMEYCQGEWLKIPSKHFLAMVESMPERIQDVLKRHGHSTRF